MLPERSSVRIFHENRLTMTIWFVSIKGNKDEFRHFEVPEEVYTYIKQLEACIRNPDSSRLRELYPERFKKPLDIR